MWYVECQQKIFHNKQQDNSVVPEFCQSILNYFLAILRLAKPESISSHILWNFNGTLIHMIVIHLYFNHDGISQELLAIF